MEFPTSQLYIDGALHPAEGGRTYGNVAPTTGKVVGQAADASASDMDAAIIAARRAFDETDWSTNVTLRVNSLRRLQSKLRKSADSYRSRIAAETGSTLAMTRIIGLDTPFEIMSWPIELAEKFEYERDIGTAAYLGAPSRRVVLKEAAGVVGAITPWNVPVLINISKLTFALAAGCTVVLKPAPDTPWSAAIIGEAAFAAGMPRGVLNVVTSGDKALLGEQLVTDPRVDVISFTGSNAVGKRIMEAAAPTLKHVFLELGGKSANVVLDDAKFPDALQSAGLVCFHAGQGCSLPTRMLIPRSRYQEAIEIIKTMFEAVPFGNPESEEQFMGPLISKVQFDRVMGYIKLGQEEGARMVVGGAANLSEGYYVKPTLFADVDNKMRIAQEEIFGPVLVAIPYDDDNDAVRIANESRYGLGGAIQSSNPERALAVARRIRTGTINVNNANGFTPDAPFGGYKQSGVGREMGIQGFEEFLETKLVALEA